MPKQALLPILSLLFIVSTLLHFLMTGGSLSPTFENVPASKDAVQNFSNLRTASAKIAEETKDSLSALLQDAPIFHTYPNAAESKHVPQTEKIVSNNTVVVTKFDMGSNVELDADSDIGSNVELETDSEMSSYVELEMPPLEQDFPETSFPETFEAGPPVLSPDTPLPPPETLVQPQYDIKDSMSWDNDKLAQKSHGLLDISMEPNPDLAAFFEKRLFQTRFNYNIVTVANVGHYTLVLNWVESMRRNMKIRDKFVVVCLDFEIYHKLQALGIPSLHAGYLINLDKHAKSGEQTYGERDYNRLTFLKFKVVYVLMRVYRLNVLFSDTDLAMREPKMFDLFDALLVDNELNDVIFTRDDIWGSNVCTGFYVARYSPFSLRLFGQVVMQSNDAGKNDQDITNDVLNLLDRGALMHVQYLDMYRFATGQMVDEGLIRKTGIEPWMFHANWRIGKTDKMNLLKKQGFWFLGETVTQ